MEKDHRIYLRITLPMKITIQGTKTAGSHLLQFSYKLAEARIAWQPLLNSAMFFIMCIYTHIIRLYVHMYTCIYTYGVGS